MTMRNKSIVFQKKLFAQLQSKDMLILLQCYKGLNLPFHKSMSLIGETKTTSMLIQLILQYLVILQVLPKDLNILSSDLNHHLLFQVKSLLNLWDGQRVGNLLPRQTLNIWITLTQSDQINRFFTELSNIIRIYLPQMFHTASDILNTLY